MENYLLVALVGATINMVLSATVPCLLNKTEKTFLEDTKKVFRTNRNAILTSSLIMGITIFLALLIVNDVLSSFTNSDSDIIITIDEGLPRSYGKSVNNLSRLNMMNTLR